LAQTGSLKGLYFCVETPS